MTAYVFTGPTITPRDAALELDAVFLPPAAQGDVYRAGLDRPRAIGIIDGFFERVPAVWHKEILWTMSQGTHVFGSASMGALRAAELAAFGMEGVGAIFEAYRDGVLEDDDEVALVHGSAEDGYRAMSEPMINVRATLAAATAAGVIARSTRAALERLAKELFYPVRTYPALLAAAAAREVPVDELDMLAQWLPSGRRDQKRADAICMLRRMRAFLADDPAPKEVGYSFAYTDAWDHACRHSAARAPAVDADEASRVSFDELLDEIRLQGEGYVQARTSALLRLLAVEEARRHGLEVSADQLRSAGAEFRRAHRIPDDDGLGAWLSDHDLDEGELAQLLEEHVLVAWVRAIRDAHIAVNLQNVLRETDEYPELRRRAQEKKLYLRERGLLNPLLAEIGCSEDDLWSWYFGASRNSEVPADVDAYARSIGFADQDALRRAVVREYCYVTRR